LLIVRHPAEHAAGYQSSISFLLNGFQMERHLHRSLARVFEGDLMSEIFIFVCKWNTWYRVLRYRKAFTFADSVRHGLWLARGDLSQPAGNLSWSSERESSYYWGNPAT
jgi:hypothetical protein